MKGLVYIIKNRANDRKYVGITIQTLKSRWMGHKSKSRSSNRPLYVAMRTLGLENFYCELLEEINANTARELKSKLNELEINHIKEQKAFIMDGGYNLTEGGGLRDLSKRSRKILGEGIRRTLQNPRIREKYREAQIQLNRERPERGIVHSKRISGKGHPRLDRTIYRFKNVETGESFCGLKFDFYQKYKLSQAKVCLLVHGKRNIHKGWVVDKNA